VIGAGPTDAVQELLELPRSERREALEELVVEEFRTRLLMDDSEELPVTTSFFDLGCTSLVIADVKEELESTLGCAISANVLFNRPTIEQLVMYLADDVLRLSAS